METWKIITNVILKHRWKRLQGAYKYTAQGVSNVNFAIKREQSQAIRTMSDEKGEPLFCGKDVAEALGYRKPENAIATHVANEDKPVPWFRGVVPTTNPQAIFINE